MLVIYLTLYVQAVFISDVYFIAGFALSHARSTSQLGLAAFRVLSSLVCLVAAVLEMQVCAFWPHFASVSSSPVAILFFHFAPATLASVLFLK